MDRRVTSTSSPAHRRQRHGVDPFLSWLGQVVGTFLGGPGAIVIGDPGPSSASYPRHPVAGIATVIGVLLLVLVVGSSITMLPWPVMAAAPLGIGAWVLIRRLHR